MTAILPSIEACLFDAYGTLFDVHSSVGRYRGRLGDRADSLSAMWRQKQLEYTWVRSLMGRHADFWQVTGEALAYAFEAHGIDDAQLEADLMRAYLELDAYPEVRMTLEVLRRHGMHTSILSNGSPQMLDSCLQASRIAELLDAVLSVEQVGIYKPDPAVYGLGSERLGIEPSRVAFLSSNGWDVAGAASFGYRAVWVNRFRQPPERLPARAEREIETLAELPGLLGL